jgi:hypothetical protein
MPFQHQKAGRTSQERGTGPNPAAGHPWLRRINQPSASCNTKPPDLKMIPRAPTAARSETAELPIRDNPRATPSSTTRVRNNHPGGGARASRRDLGSSTHLSGSRRIRGIGPRGARFGGGGGIGSGGGCRAVPRWEAAAG